MSNLIVIARVTAKEGHADEVKAALLELVEPTLKEEGCIQYDCHQDLEDANKFYFYEIWESADHLNCLLYTSPSPRDATLSRMPSSA